MENNNYSPEQNGSGLPAEQAVPQSEYSPYAQYQPNEQYSQYQQYPQGVQYNRTAYAPYPASPYTAPKKNNTALAPVLMGVAAFLAYITFSVAGVIQGFFFRNVDTWTAPYASTNLYSFFANLFPLLIVGGLGFASYKSLKGALKFMGCYFLARSVANIFTNIIYSIYYAVELAEGEYYNYSSVNTVSVISGIFSLIIVITLSVVLLFLLEKHTAKKEAAQTAGLNTPVDMYGNPIIKKDNFVMTAALVSFLTVFINTVGTAIVSVISAGFASGYVDYTYYFTSSLISNISGIFFSIITIAVLAGISYAMTKSAEKAAKAVGCYMAGSCIASIITNLLLFIFYLAFASIISISFIGVAQLVTNVVSILITAAVAFIVAKVSEDKKQLPVYNSVY